MRSEDESPSVWSALGFSTIGIAMKKHEDHRERRNRLAGAMWCLLESVATSVPLSVGLKTLAFTKKSSARAASGRSIDGPPAGLD